VSCLVAWTLAPRAHVRAQALERKAVVEQQRTRTPIFEMRFVVFSSSARSTCITGRPSISIERTSERWGRSMRGLSSCRSIARLRGGSRGRSIDAFKTKGADSSQRRQEAVVVGLRLAASARGGCSRGAVPRNFPWWPLSGLFGADAPECDQLGTIRSRGRLWTFVTTRSMLWTPRHGRLDRSIARTGLCQIQRPAHN
jgi:hypothetical protein